MSNNKVVATGVAGKTAVRKVTKKLVVMKKASVGEVTTRKVVEQEALTLMKSGLAVIPGKASVEEVAVIVSNYREHTRKKLAKEFSKIVDKMLEAAKTGKLSDTKMKLLLELAGVKEDPSGYESRSHGPSLGKLLLNEIKQKRKTALAVLNKSIAEKESIAETGSTAEEAGAVLIAVAASSAPAGDTMWAIQSGRECGQQRDSQLWR